MTIASAEPTRVKASGLVQAAQDFPRIQFQGDRHLDFGLEACRIG
ncbi:MAG: hypothetical protein AAF921_01525 [Cyanobacteria bacterium P01_D01_bin.44]